MCRESPRSWTPLDHPSKTLQAVIMYKIGFETLCDPMDDLNYTLLTKGNRVRLVAGQ